MDGPSEIAKLEAIDACSCPRAPGEKLSAPLCPTEVLMGGEEGVLFVTKPADVSCQHLRRFGNGHFCTCKKRIHLSSAFGI